MIAPALTKTSELAVLFVFILWLLYTWKPQKDLTRRSVYHFAHNNCKLDAFIAIKFPSKDFTSLTELSYSNINFSPSQKRRTPSFYIRFYRRFYFINKNITLFFIVALAKTYKGVFMPPLKGWENLHWAASKKLVRSRQLTLNHCLSVGFVKF